MSLYTPESMIRRLILEAEALTLNPSEDAQGIENAASASPDEVQAEMQQSSMPPPENPGLQGSTLNMPQGAPPPPTTTKTVVDNNIILVQLNELKTIIAGYEKKFDVKIILTPEQSNVIISGLLDTLVQHAVRLNKFMETSLAEPAPEEALSPTPTPAPEVPIESPTTPEETPIEAPPESGLGETPANEAPLMPSTPQV